MTGWWVAAALMSLALGVRASAQPRPEARDGAELWRFEREYFVPRAITADGQRVVVEHNLSVDYHSMLLLDAANGAVVADLSPAFPPSSTLWPITACGSVLVATLESQPSSIAGIDAARGNVRWRARGEPNAPGFRIPYGGAADGRGGEVVLTHERTGIVGVDGGDGRVRWRSGLARGSFIPRGFGIATDPSLPGFAFMPREERGRIGALDVATGRAGWVYPPSGEAPCQCGDFAADGRRVAVSCNRGEVAIVDGRTGTARSIRVDGWESCPLVDLAGDTLTVANWARVDVYDVATGARRWTQPIRNGGDVYAGRDGVLVTTAGGAVRSLDSATGRELWRWWVPVGVRDDAAPVVLFGRGTASGHDVVLTFSARAVARLGPPPGPTPTEATTTTITGRAQLDGAVRRGLGVLVGEDLVRTDARGNYRATVHGRGVLRVAIWDGPLRRRHRCLVTPPTAVPLDGARERVRVNLRARSGPEMCGGCECD